MAAAGSAALTGGVLAPRAAKAEAFDAASDERVCRGVCRPNCFGYCHLNVHVRDGVVVKTSRAPYSDERYSRICQRGLSHPQRMYDESRLQYPLRRVEGTARGAGQWERISWDEAFSDLARHIEDAQSQHGPQAFAQYTGSSSAQLLASNMYARLWGLLKPCAVSTAVDMGNYFAQHRLMGQMSNMWEGNDAADMLNAKSIVLWGSNVTDSQIQTWHFVKEAQQNGTKLVCVDPIYTYAASKSDLWVPVKPGTDMPLYMGIMHEVVEQGKVDTAYMSENTVAPFLVRSDNGRFLRGSDLGWDVVDTGKTNPMTQQEVIVDQYVSVQDGRLVGNLASTTPDLTATYDFNGVECRTAYSLLLDEISKFDLETVSDLTEVSVDQVRELADICTDGPVTHYTGFGEQAHSNGHHASEAGYTMAALTGDLGKPGASYGNCWYMYPFSNADFAKPDGVGDTTPGMAVNDLPKVLETGRFQGKDFPVTTLFVCFGNPLNTAMDTNRLRAAFDKLDYIAVADPMMTSTAKYADLVLPVCQWFETTDVTFAGQTITLSYNEKAVEPLYESKSDADIVRGLADALGLGGYFDGDDEALLHELIDTRQAAAFGITYDKVKEEGDVRFVADSPHVAWAGGAAAGAFTTPSGRIEFYQEDPKPAGAYEEGITPDLVERERLPRWFEPGDAHLGERGQQYPINLMSERPRYRVHSQWAYTPALRELDPEPFFKMNPADAKARGLADGSYAECFNDNGHCVAKLQYSDAVRPGCAVYPKSWEVDQYKEGSWTELVSNSYDPFLANANFMDTMCEVRAWGGQEE